MPAPAAPMVEQTPIFKPPAAGQWSINGIYQSSCKTLQVPGTTQVISSADLLVVADGFASLQRYAKFFYSTDCSGSVYATYQYPAHRAQYIGQRLTNLPDSGQAVNAAVFFIPAFSAPMQVYGAVMSLPTNPAAVGVVVNGVQVFGTTLIQQIYAGSVLVYATRNGLYITGNSDSGTVLDGQGYPTRLLGEMAMARIQ